MLNKRKDKLFYFLLYLFFALVCACFIIPLLVVISASFTSENELLSGGFSLFPKEFTTAAYQSAFKNSEKMICAYLVTIAESFGGTFLTCVVCGMIGYALSRSSFRFKKPITWVVMFTMLFSAGMIPTYIVYSKYYHISNSFWIYILPGITGGAWNTMVFRTFFRTLPESLFESARLDGANELTIFFKIVIPLSTPVFASLGFMMLVGKWNDYTTSMIYIRNENLYTLQYLLQKIMSESEFLKSMAQAGMVGISLDAFSGPSETLKFAMCIIAAGPMLVIFPFFQKYFSQGLTIGAVKG